MENIIKTPTEWSKNPSSKANSFAYDDSTVAYDSPLKNYDGVVDTDMSDREILPTDWTKTGKSPVSWSKTDKTPTDWTKTGKSPVSWSKTDKTPTDWTNG